MNGSVADAEEGEAVDRDTHERQLGERRERLLVNPRVEREGAVATKQTASEEVAALREELAKEKMRADKLESRCTETQAQVRRERRTEGVLFFFVLEL